MFKKKIKSHSGFGQMLHLYFDIYVCVMQLLSKSMSDVGQDAGELQQLDWSRHHGDLKER